MSSNPFLKKLAPQECLLLVIDLQEKFLPYLKHSPRVLQSARLLADVARELRLPVVVSEHNPKRIGPTVPELAGKLAEARVFAKDAFSCFDDAAIREAIQSHGGRKSLLIAGCETHICVLQTTIDALHLGYSVHVAADGVGSRRELDWRAGLQRIAGCGGVVSTSEMMAYELLGRSDTASFKALLPSFKEWVKRDDD